MFTQQSLAHRADSRSSKRLLLFAILLAALSCVANVVAAGNYVLLRLPKGVSFELPKNWMAISDNQRITLDAFVQAKTEKISGGSTNSELPFAANYYDERGQTAGIFNIRYYPSLDVTQNEAKGASPKDVKELDEMLQEQLRPGVEAAGNRVLEWRGTRKVRINGLTAFISEYRRSSPQGTPFRAQLVRVLNGTRSFTLTISYREDQHFFLGPICDRVIGSLRA